MTPFDTLVAAAGGIAGNKLRAALTMLGIVIGVAAVILMLALGNGARAAVDANFRFLGSDVVRIAVCLLYTSPSPRDGLLSRMPSSA